MSHTSLNVLGVGRCTLDYIGVVERLTQSDSRTELEQFSIQGGGTAATAIAVLARWGIQTKFVGKVGDDRRGDQIRSTLSGEGVDVHDMIIVPGGISQCDFTFVEESTAHTRSYFTQGNISPMRDDEVELSWLDDQDILLVDASCPDAQCLLLKEARARGITTVLDAFEPSAHGERLVELADYLIASERFISRMTGEGSLDKMLTASLEFGPKVTVITLGSEGCVSVSKAQPEPLFIDAFDVEVIDRTGAGDVYHGAFMYAICQGWPLERCVRYANVAAAHCCAQIGGRCQLPTPEEIEQLCG